MSNNNQRPEPPLAVLRDGAIKASIWENQGEKGAYLTTKFAKTYEDRDGQVKDTAAFTQSVLLKVSELARQAYHENKALRESFQQDTPQQQTEPQAQQGQRRRWGRVAARPGGSQGR
ncbi:MAG: hypothetical protein HRU11_11395 [Parvularculaceae bacterium]|nr:hypothetical protein [Parvularculaceae bacterium]